MIFCSEIVLFCSLNSICKEQAHVLSNTQKIDFGEPGLFDTCDLSLAYWSEFVNLNVSNFLHWPSH